MNRDLLERVAFAIQDETMTRLKALQYARAALGAIQQGDNFGNGLVAIFPEAPKERIKLSTRKRIHLRHAPMLSDGDDVLRAQPVGTMSV